MSRRPHRAISSGTSPGLVACALAVDWVVQHAILEIDQGWWPETTIPRAHVEGDPPLIVLII